MGSSVLNISVLSEIALFERGPVVDVFILWGVSSPVLNWQKWALKQLLRIQGFLEFKLANLASALDSS